MTNKEDEHEEEEEEGWVGGRRRQEEAAHGQIPIWPPVPVLERWTFSIRVLSVPVMIYCDTITQT